LNKEVSLIKISSLWGTGVIAESPFMTHPEKYSAYRYTFSRMYARNRRIAYGWGLFIIIFNFQVLISSSFISEQTTPRENGMRGGQVTWVFSICGGDIWV